MAGWTAPTPAIARISTDACNGTRTRRDPASCSSPPAAAGLPRAAGGEDIAALRFRMRCVRTARESGIDAALALGVSRASLHRWRRWHAEGGIAALRDRPRGPGPGRLPAWVEQAVIVVRLLTYWNSKRLAAEFTRRDIWPLGHHAVDRLLADLGTARPSSTTGAWPRLRAGPAQRAVAHRHQGSLLPPAGPGRVHQGLDRGPRR